MIIATSPFRNARRRILAVVALACFLVISTRSSADEYERLEAATERWLELEKRIAAERNDWKSKKEILAQNVRVLESNIETLSESLETITQAAEITAAETARNMETFESQEISRQFYVAKLEELTERFDRYRASAPDFLKEELDSAREKLDEADPAALGERAQILVAAFTNIEEFNRSITVESVPRRLKDGREVMISVIYWGLARAYAVDPEGTEAWELTPAADGWIWNERPDYLDQILEVVRIYDQTRPPSIQNLPGRALNMLEGEG